MQGFVLSPDLFSMYIEHIMRKNKGMQRREWV